MIGIGRGRPFGGRVAYALTGGGKRYDFYVRQYANTLTWTYGDDASTPQSARQVADDLVGRLKDMAREVSQNDLIAAPRQRETKGRLPGNLIPEGVP